MSFFNKKSIVVGLAIFSMFFGAGNLIFAVNVGKQFQSQTWIALLGFMTTAVCLPVLGVVAILLNGGDRKLFFGRAGKIVGSLLSLSCFFVIGPVIAMPRIVTLSYTVFEPVFPHLPLWLFSAIFLAIVYALTIAEGRIIDILGKIISPILIVSLITIVAAAFFQPSHMEELHLPAQEIILKNLEYGYNTLDFLTSMFFGAIVISILKQAHGEDTKNIKSLVALGLRGSLIGVGLLALVYVGLAWAGAWHGHELAGLNEAEVFRTILERVLGREGMIVVGVAILMACISTIIALAAVAAEYFKTEFFANRISYRTGLVLSLAITGFFSLLGLSSILEFSKPLITVIHPGIIILALLNIFRARRRASESR